MDAHILFSRKKLFSYEGLNEMNDTFYLTEMRRENEMINFDFFP